MEETKVSQVLRALKTIEDRAGERRWASAKEVGEITGLTEEQSRNALQWLITKRHLESLITPVPGRSGKNATYRRKAGWYVSIGKCEICGVVSASMKLAGKSNQTCGHLNCIKRQISFKRHGNPTPLPPRKDLSHIPKGDLRHLSRKREDGTRGAFTLTDYDVRRLAAAVLLDALENVKKRTLVKTQHLDWRTDLEWTTRPGSSFEHWCEAVDIEPRHFRAKIMEAAR
jgi:hypothetical protein